MKTTRKMRAFLILLSLLMILPMFAACDAEKEETTDESTEESSEVSTEEVIPPEPVEVTSTLRVMSFNVQEDLPTVSGALTQPALNRIEAVKQEILFYSPDLLGIQEDTLTWLLNLKLDDYNLIQDSANGVDSDDERCAIYYKKGMTLLDSGTHWLNPTGVKQGVALTYAEVTDPNSKFYLTDEERRQLQITCDEDLKTSRKTYWDEKSGTFVTGTSGYSLTTSRKFTYGVFDINGQTVIYINTHLTHRSQMAAYSNATFQKIRSNARIKEWDILMGHLADLEEKFPESLVIFTGDLNDTKGMPIYQYICDLGYSSAEAVTPEHIGILGSWNSPFDTSLQGDCYPQNQHLEGNGTSYLDYCFVGEGLTVDRFTVGEGKAEITLADGSKKILYTSDHLPIITDLSFTTFSTGETKPAPEDPPAQDPNLPSVYSGLPDIAWYTGDKTEYTLTTAAEFVGMLTIRQESKGATTFEGVTIKLANDLVFNQGSVEDYLNSGSVFEIQSLNSKYQFKGTFDGQGHTISGIYINAETSAIKGLFGGLGDNAVIKNLNLTNCYANGPSVEDKTVLGILAARISGTNVVFSNIKIDGILEEDSVNFNAVGALAGRVDKNCSLTIENCEVSGSIKFGTYGTHCGSLVGLAQSGASIAIKNCKSDMDVTCQNYCGGLVGYDTSGKVTIDSQSSYTGTLTCPGTKGNLIGNK